MSEEITECVAREGRLYLYFLSCPNRNRLPHRQVDREDKEWRGKRVEGEKRTGKRAKKGDLPCSTMTCWITNLLRHYNTKTLTLLLEL